MLGLLATTLLVAPAGIGEGGGEAAPSYTLRAELQTGVNAPLGVVSGSARTCCAWARSRSAPR